MGMFSALPHKKNLRHNDVCPPEQEGSQPLGLHICSFHFIELRCSAQLSCSLSGLTKPALDDQRLTWIQNVKRKPAEGRAQSDPISGSKRQFYLWTGHSLSQRRTQRNDCGKQAFRLIQLFPKLTLMQGLMEVQRWLWARPWQVSTGDKRSMLFLKLLSACSSCPEDQKIKVTLTFTLAIAESTLNTYTLLVVHQAFAGLADQGNSPALS